MKRNVDIDEISDGRRYRSNDMVRIGSKDCSGCSECCRMTDDTIILDPYDIYQLNIGLGADFYDLLGDEGSGMIELGLANSLLLPHLKLDPSGSGCPFLTPEGRCGIHSFRPGFCRLFPLGRIYENGGFSYFIQIHECPYPNKTKVKIKNWIGIDELDKYEDYILKWHDLLESKRNGLAKIKDHDEMTRYLTGLLNRYYAHPYDPSRSFYEQFDERLATDT